MESEAMAFNKLPIEVNQMIALNLSDKDVASFRLICCAANDAVDADNNSFWFYRYQDEFDAPEVPHTSNDDTKAQYQYRKRIVNEGVVFKCGQHWKETRLLALLKELVLEAHPVVGDDFVVGGASMSFIKKIIKRTNILEAYFTRQIGSQLNRDDAGLVDLQLIQLVLASKAMTFNHDTVRSFEASQYLAYQSTGRLPMFGGPSGTDVNIPYCLHLVNFFRHHFMSQVEQTLLQAWQNLSTNDDGLGVPQLWKEKLNNNMEGDPIGKQWMGTYAYLDRGDVDEMRLHGGPSSTKFYQDKNVDGGDIAIQRLRINFPALAPYPWPKIFERQLDSVGFHRKYLDPRMRVTRGSNGPRAQHSNVVPMPEARSRRFDGLGYDDEDFFGGGWLNPLPAQHGVPGFKRMTMMKFFQDANGIVDAGALWAYEGVVLPGNQVIVGRWWAPDGRGHQARLNQYSGPFILWNVDSLRAKQTADKATEQHDLNMGIAASLADQ